tara:strand:- start:1014 stop:2630 length:1617 start_codon:yes stop_codon:yes gene_type:complete
MENIKLNIPKEWICPITCAIMKDPVVAKDGFSYEREAIEKWFATSGTPSSPKTGAFLASTNLVPNNNLRIEIQDFVTGLQDKGITKRTIDVHVMKTVPESMNLLFGYFDRTIVDKHGYDNMKQACREKKIACNALEYQCKELEEKVTRLKSKHHARQQALEELHRVLASRLLDEGEGYIFDCTMEMCAEDIRQLSTFLDTILALKMHPAVKVLTVLEKLLGIFKPKKHVRLRVREIHKVIQKQQEEGKLHEEKIAQLKKELNQITTELTTKEEQVEWWKTRHGQLVINFGKEVIRSGERYQRDQQEFQICLEDLERTLGLKSTEPFADRCKRMVQEVETICTRQSIPTREKKRITSHQVEIWNHSNDLDPRGEAPSMNSVFDFDQQRWVKKDVCEPEAPSMSSVFDFDRVKKDVCEPAYDVLSLIYIPGNASVPPKVGEFAYYDSRLFAKGYEKSCWFVVTKNKKSPRTCFYSLKEDRACDPCDPYITCHGRILQMEDVSVLPKLNAKKKVCGFVWRMLLFLVTAGLIPLRLMQLLPV